MNRVILRYKVTSSTALPDGEHVFVTHKRYPDQTIEELGNELIGEILCTLGPDDREHWEFIGHYERLVP